MADRIKIPRSICDRAQEIYKKLYMSKKLSGCTIEGQLAASMFLACRQLEEPRTFKEIGATTQCPNKELHKCYKMALPVLGISAVPQGKPADHITRYCARLQIKDYGVQSAAKHVACAVQRENLLMGKHPISVACACIYLVGQLSDPASQRSFDQLAYVSAMAVSTIQKAYSEIYLRRLTLVPIDVEDVKWFTTTDLVHAMPPP